MISVLCPSQEQVDVLPSRTTARGVKYQSFWVLLGFIFWFGFYLGAMLMHAVTK